MSTETLDTKLLSEEHHNRIVHLDEAASKRPIQLPESVYITALKNFGVAEGIAGVVDLLSTTIANNNLPPSWKQWILPFVGPVIEKGFFFGRTYGKGIINYYKEPSKNRKTFKHYRHEAYLEGLDDLIDDVSIHDPIYTAGMFTGVRWTHIHPAVLSLLSYVVGIAIVVEVKAIKSEVKFGKKKKQLVETGFGHEKYYEARFLIDSDFNAEDAISRFRREFKTGEPVTTHYHDDYFLNNLPEYSNRTPKLRLRTRTRRPYEKDNAIYGTDSERVTSMQVTFTKAREQKARKLDQYRYFPAEKQKMWRILPRITMPSDIPDEHARTLVEQLIDRPYGSIDFDRTVANNSELSICTDHMNFERPFYVLELKVYKDTKLLIEAMRYAMAELPVVVQQTTHGKSDLFI